MPPVFTGLESLKNTSSLQQKIKGNLGLLCHGASIDSHFTHSASIIQKIYGARLLKLFGPQHGFVCDVQDNMVESADFFHPYFKLPVHSLYGETRTPTPQMLENLDTLIIDLQDVGTRVYTYIATLSLTMQACANSGVEVIVLDRPNPIGGAIIEGNILNPKFKSFVGLHPIPMRHAMTMGEMAQYLKQFQKIDCGLTVIPMQNWQRQMFFKETALPWVLPSPNLPTAESALCFPGTVLFEGCNVSEGRGTTKSLEIVGAPGIEPFSFVEQINKALEKTDLQGFILRPIYFHPTFGKHQDTPCGGLQIHITDPKTFRPWRLGQFLMRQFYLSKDFSFQWKQEPYEYEFEKLAIDLINGTDQIRSWIENSGDLNELSKISDNSLFLEQRAQVLLYR